MKTFFTIALLSIFTAISAQEIQKENKIDATIETVSQTESTATTEVKDEATLEVTEEVARLFKRRNSLIKRELKLYTKAQRSKLA
jgi:hypothetical protein